jgi:hypothetical protein
LGRDEGRARPTTYSSGKESGARRERHCYTLLIDAEELRVQGSWEAGLNSAVQDHATMVVIDEWHRTASANG